MRSKHSDNQKALRLIAHYRHIASYGIPSGKQILCQCSAYDSNLTDEQAKKIFGALKDMGVDYVRGQEAAKKQLLESTDAALRKEYGSRYTEKIRMLKKGIDAHGGNELGRVLQESGVLYHPAVVKLFIALGESGSEPRQPLKNEGQADTYVPTSQGGSFKFKGLTGAKT